MEWISSWIQGIIIAVIIGTIIEMILPEGNCKKYIKVVIGVYILFSIISPVITKITGNEFRVSDIFDLEKYIEVSSQNTQTNVKNNQQNQIKQIYISNLKKDIKQKIEQKGYEINNINIEVENNNEYTLKNITLQVYKKEEKEENNTVEDQINAVDKIEIQIANNINNTTNNNKEHTSISSKEKKDLKEYLSNMYSLKEENININ
ncbi:MAG: stage III sporulation protein AF [Clostridia bacterium]